MEVIEILATCAITGLVMLPFVNWFDKKNKELSKRERDE